MVEGKLSNFFVSLLVFTFGLGSWVAINGIWVELPLLVQLGVPEQYKLSSYLVVIIQLANIGPVTFIILNSLLKNNKQSEKYANYFILTLGTASCFLLIFFWNSYSVWKLEGENHSTFLMLLTFFVALVDCTSSVTFAPFISQFRKVYITWLFIGESCSSLLPSLVALMQGVGKTTSVANSSHIVVKDGFELNCTNWERKSLPSHFGPEVFFGILTALMGLSLLSHLFLNMQIFTKNERRESLGADATVQKEQQPLLQSDALINQDGLSREGRYLRSPCYTHQVYVHNKSKTEICCFMVVVGILQCLGNGVLSAVFSFSTGAYGLRTYSLCAALTSMVPPIASFLVYLKPHRNTFGVFLSASIGIAFAVYCFVVGITYQNPPLQDQFLGRFFVIFAWLMQAGMFTYTTASIGWIFRNEPNSRSLLRWQGGVSQTGSLLGAIVMFIVVRYSPRFQTLHQVKMSPVCEVIQD